jgi:hypothetical protein
MTLLGKVWRGPGALTALLIAGSELHISES